MKGRRNGLGRSHRWRHCGVFAVLTVVACSPDRRTTVTLPADAHSTRRTEPPVAINPEPPVDYPAALFEQGIEGKVVLRLYTDEQGIVVSDSTRVAESSGYPALDSAAVRAVPRLRFAPARANGTPVAAAFLQPVHFRHPQREGTTP
jgi:protein TonB